MLRKNSEEKNRNRLKIRIIGKNSEDEKENQFNLVEEKLAQVLESRIRERREYLELIKQTKNMNLSLYNNMMKADTERADALFVNGCKSQHGKSNTQDEEEIALNWAYDTIKNEYLRRMQIRSQIEKGQKGKSSKRKSRWTSKKLEAEKMKRKKETGKLFLTSNGAQKQEEKKCSTNEIICESKEIKAKRSLEKLLAKEENDSTKIDPEQKEPEKHHVEIIRIQDTMKNKLTPLIYTTNILKTDGERAAAAQKLLSHLQEKKRIRNDDKVVKDGSQERLSEAYQSKHNDLKVPKMFSKEMKEYRKEGNYIKVRGTQLIECE